MNKSCFLKFIVSLLITIPLAGCSILDNYFSPRGDLQNDTHEIDGHTHKSNSWCFDETQHWMVCDECRTEFAKANHEYEVSYTEGAITYTCFCGYSYEETDTSPTEYITINSSNFYNFNKYDTGNYGYTHNLSDLSLSWDFIYYRVVSHLDYCFRILPFVGSKENSNYPGAFMNYSSLGQIKSITINYNSTYDFKVYYGNSATRDKYFSIDNSSGVTREISLYQLKSRYFSIEAEEGPVDIVSIVIAYEPLSETHLESVTPSHPDYRIPTTTYDGELVPGESFIDMPLMINTYQDTYTVAVSKRYTYYTYDYVVSNPSVANYAALTSPVDVANYYIAFGTYPANYVEKANAIDAATYFGDDVRVRSFYTRTDGYATCVPANGNPPQYYELDIQLEGTSYSYADRGVGRLVCWRFGFNNYGGSNRVVLYTDDHYATFQEYLNNGEFGDRFSGELMVASHTYIGATTLELISA